jgi:hypothetical protein
MEPLLYWVEKPDQLDHSDQSAATGRLLSALNKGRWLRFLAFSLTADFRIDVKKDGRRSGGSGAPCIAFGGSGLPLDLNGFSMTGLGDPQTACGGNSTGNEYGISVNVHARAQPRLVCGVGRNLLLAGARALLPQPAAALAISGR